MVGCELQPPCPSPRLTHPSINKIDVRKEPVNTQPIDRHTIRLTLPSSTRESQPRTHLTRPPPPPSVLNAKVWMGLDNGGMNDDQRHTHTRARPAPSTNQSNRWSNRTYSGRGTSSPAALPGVTKQRRTPGVYSKKSRGSTTVTSQSPSPSAGSSSWRVSASPAKEAPATTTRAGGGAAAVSGRVGSASSGEEVESESRPPIVFLLCLSFACWLPRPLHKCIKICLMR